MKYLIICLILLPLYSFGQQLTKAEIRADRDIINDALHNKTTTQILVDQVIPDKQTAIAVVEPILFKIYGKEQIVGERPYVIDLVDGYWIIYGALKELPGQIVMGGTFLIVLSAKDGRVIKLTHGK
jgi:hypothetical protein